MADPAAGLERQLRNIERTYGVPVDRWFAIIAASQPAKHSDIIKMLKDDHGLAHSAAHRLSVAYRARVTGRPRDDPVEALYHGRPTQVRAIHDALMRFIEVLSDDIEVAPKKGYVSLRRRKQFAMIKPSRARVDLGLILKDTPIQGRLEEAGSFNRLFTHRVRLTTPVVDRDLGDWIRRAHAAAR